MSFFEQYIYSNLPVALQNICISAYGYSWNKRRFGGIFEEHYKGFLRREDFTSNQWHDYQTIELRKILVHAFNTVPFYNRTYSNLGFKLSDFLNFEISDLHKLPVLTKNDLRCFGTSDLLSSVKEEGSVFFNSSGSTGTPVSILYSNNFHQKISAALEARVRNWAGISRFNSRGMIGGRKILGSKNYSPPFHRYNIFEKQLYFSAYHISKTNSFNYLEAIRKYRLDYMTGYAYSNYYLASILLNLNVDIPNLKAVITSSEKLTSEMRDTLSKAYNCNVFDSYSGVEYCGLISQFKDKLFISPDVGLIEIPNNISCDNNYNEGDILCTGFLNYSQPLIRYQIGDHLRISNYNSSYQGINMPEVYEIIGRNEDVIETLDGRKMVRFHSVYYNIVSIKKAQLIQHSLSKYSLNIVTENELKPFEVEELLNRLKYQLGQNVEIRIFYMKDIPLTNNGKFKSVISEIK